MSHERHDREKLIQTNRSHHEQLSGREHRQSAPGIDLWRRALVKRAARIGAAAKNREKYLVARMFSSWSTPPDETPSEGPEMERLLALSRRIDRVSELFGVVADRLVLLACLVSAGNALVRYLINYSSNAWLEVQWYMFGALVFLGASHTLRMNEHVRVDILYSWVSERTRLWIDAVGFAVVFMPVLAVLAYLSWPFFLRSFVSGEYSSNSGGLIMWPVKFFIPFGFTYLMVQGASELIKRIAALRGAYTLEHEYERPVQ
jgi:TRAP-type mannitol/chloroaromatic compound transport system permease small subunit